VDIVNLPKCLEKNIFRREPFSSEAFLLSIRAQNIKIPKPNPDDWCVRYQEHREEFADFRIIPANTRLEADPANSWRSDRLDFSVLKQLKSYDKLGSHLLITRFKADFFGNENVRLTRGRCEEFFGNPDNFLSRAQNRPDFEDLLFTHSPDSLNDEGRSSVRPQLQLIRRTDSGGCLLDVAEPTFLAPFEGGPVVTDNDVRLHNSMAGRERFGSETAIVELEETATLEGLFGEAEMEKRPNVLNNGGGKTLNGEVEANEVEEAANPDWLFAEAEFEPPPEV
jgi:hypothetical protein